MTERDNESPLTVLGLSLFAGAPLAHGGVENPKVLERMKSISAQVKVLSETFKGERVFDAAALNAAIDRIESQSAQVVPLFKDEERDPKSEALPAIWQDFEGFSENAQAMMTASESWNGEIKTTQDLRAAVLDLGVTCKSCHDDYRE